MKKPFKKIILIFIFTLIIKVYPNPIMIFLINEIKVDSGGFFIELRTEGVDPLTDYFLTSLTDTVYLNNGISLDGTLTVITEDSLSDHFEINPNGDIIQIHRPGEVLEELRFGNVENSTIAAPKSGQSINLYNYFGIESQIYYYYLDNTPTPGSENDSCGAMGYLQGTVVDSLERPVTGLEISYEYKEIPPDSVFYLTVITDSNAYFILKNYAKRQSLWARDGDYVSDFLTETQIYPEDTVTVRIDYNKLTRIKPQSGELEKRYQLEQNYPNPFNSSTLFSYSLPYNDFVKIAVFTIAGEQVAVLHSGYQTAGAHKITWRPGSAVVSGLYFYRLQTSELILHKKCLYIK